MKNGSIQVKKEKTFIIWCIRQGKKFHQKKKPFSAGLVNEATK